MKHELMITAETRVTLGVSEANRLHRYAQAQAEMAASWRVGRIFRQRR